MDQLYYSGEEIHIGDHVRYAGHSGKIVFVVDRAEYSPDFPEKDWAHHKTGFMIQTPAYGLVMLDKESRVLATTPCRGLSFSRWATTQNKGEDS